MLLVDAVETEDGDAALNQWLLRRGHQPAEAAAVIERMRKNWHRISQERLTRLLEQAGFRIKEPFFMAFGYLGILAEKA
ncbi:hypothetical protein [uncultured Martelella sp.]|uniref:hypothetical protein n=1 Tax=uncultured Martelella sp. TaxID=392331 RepID=UPI0029C7DA90|nr:hypothetical protein [uncultured Martelella sp.]